MFARDCEIEFRVKFLCAAPPGCCGPFLHIVAMSGVPRLLSAESEPDDVDLILADDVFDAFTEALQPADLDISDDMTMSMQDGFSSWSLPLNDEATAGGLPSDPAALLGRSLPHQAPLASSGLMGGMSSMSDRQIMPPVPLQPAFAMPGTSQTPSAPMSGVPSSSMLPPPTVFTGVATTFAVPSMLQPSPGLMPPVVPACPIPPLANAGATGRVAAATASLSGSASPLQSRLQSCFLPSLSEVPSSGSPAASPKIGGRQDITKSGTDPLRVSPSHSSNVSVNSSPVGGKSPRSALADALRTSLCSVLCTSLTSLACVPLTRTLRACPRPVAHRQTMHRPALGSPYGQPTSNTAIRPAVVGPNGPNSAPPSFRFLELGRVAGQSQVASSHQFVRRKGKNVPNGSTFAAALPVGVARLDPPPVALPKQAGLWSSRLPTE